jgi:hypothetical protein
MAIGFGLALERYEKGVDGDVVEAGQFGLQLLAVGAVGIAEDGHLALAIAADRLDRITERQLIEADGGRCRARGFRGRSRAPFTLLACASFGPVMSRRVAVSNRRPKRK